MVILPTTHGNLQPKNQIVDMISRQVLVIGFTIFFVLRLLLGAKMTGMLG
jgi:hypothetical protein